MTEEMEELYRLAKRFDEGKLYQSAEYEVIARTQRELYKKMRALFDPAIASLLDEYTDAIGDEMELECKHFFMQGYFMGRLES